MILPRSEWDADPALEVFPVLQLKDQTGNGASPGSLTSFGAAACQMTRQVQPLELHTGSQSTVLSLSYPWLLVRPWGLRWPGANLYSKVTVRPWS